MAETKSTTTKVEVHETALQTLVTAVLTIVQRVGTSDPTLAQVAKDLAVLHDLLGIPLPGEVVPAVEPTPETPAHP